MPDILPAQTSPDDAPPLERLLAIMARLRDPRTGCEWDRVQTFATIAPYTIEEAYEVADAIARDDLGALGDELGDLLLQVVFHARIAEEAGAFDFAAVAAGIADKIERRHPHIFGNAALPQQWDDLKAAERVARGTTAALGGIALALPALMRAEKIQQRAARVGFDWPGTAGPADKVVEELAELASATTAANRLEEAGDLLFAAVNLARKHGIAAEDALRAANAKFERRFAAMEALAAERGENFAALDLSAQEGLWQAVKLSEVGVAP